MGNNYGKNLPLSDGGQRATTGAERWAVVVGSNPDRFFGERNHSFGESFVCK
jgi:hypothetical protein